MVVLLRIRVFRDVKLYHWVWGFWKFPATQHHIPEDLNHHYTYSQFTVTDLK
jgi:hypothetical protein